MISDEGGDDAPAEAPVSRIKRFMPALVWLPKYQRSWLRKDVIAGLSVWALMVPTSLGYATLPDFRFRTACTRRQPE